MNKFRLIASILTLVLAAGHAPSFAQDDDERKFENIATQKVKAMSQALFKKLEPIRENLSAEQPNFNTALSDLRDISTDKLPGHEKAEIYNLMGYTHYSLGNTDDAVAWYERLINEPEANAPLKIRTLKTVSQLYLGAERYQEALRYLRQWMATQEIIGAPDYALLSMIYYSMEDLDNALLNIEKAIGLRTEKGELGQENWYSIQRSIYYQRGDYRKVIEVLELLVTHFPNTRYWREMGGMYAELEDRDMQMYIYDIAHIQGGLETEGQLLALAYMYIGKEAPHRAAKIIQEGMDAGIIEKNEKNMELLGNTIYQSRDVARALPVMEEAAKLASDGDIHSRLANIYLDLEQFENAEKAAREAIRRGGLRRPDIIQMVLGTALFNQQKYDQAITEFRKIRDERTIRTRDQWIVYVERERDFRRQLAAAGITL